MNINERAINYLILSFENSWLDYFHISTDSLSHDQYNPAKTIDNFEWLLDVKRDQFMLMTDIAMSYPSKSRQSYRYQLMCHLMDDVQKKKEIRRPYYYSSHLYHQRSPSADYMRYS